MRSIVVRGAQMRWRAAFDAIEGEKVKGQPACR
jgi:hypothetical protein